MAFHSAGGDPQFDAGRSLPGPVPVDVREVKKSEGIPYMQRNADRMNEGLNAYLIAMRRYISARLRKKEGGDWFNNRVMSVLYRWQDEIDEGLKRGRRKEDVLEFKHFPVIIKAEN